MESNFLKKAYARVSFFLPGQTNFVQTFYFVQSLFFLVETVTEISGRRSLKKDHILNNVTGFQASVDFFFHFLRTGVKCFQ